MGILIFFKCLIGWRFLPKSTKSTAFATVFSEGILMKKDWISCKHLSLIYYTKNVRFDLFGGI